MFLEKYEFNKFIILTLEACIQFSVYYSAKKNFPMQYYYAREGYKFASSILEFSTVKYLIK